MSLSNSDYKPLKASNSSECPGYNLMVLTRLSAHKSRIQLILCSWSPSEVTTGLGLEDSLKRNNAGSLGMCSFSSLAWYIRKMLQGEFLITVYGPPHLGKNLVAHFSPFLWYFRAFYTKPPVLMDSTLSPDHSTGVHQEFTMYIPWTQQDSVWSPLKHQD